MMRSILTHPAWPALKPYCVIQTYDRDGSAKNPRIRIEFKKMPAGLVEQALSLEVDCASCGNPIKPIRARKAPAKRGSTPSHLYYAAACPLNESVGCSRGNAAREEYLNIKHDVLGE